MKKIPCLFRRDATTGRVTSDVTPGCEWVLDGEARATRKFDGAAAMIRSVKLFKRFDAKSGKATPPGFEPCQEPDATTGHWPGWVPVGTGPEDRWFREAGVIYSWRPPLHDHCPQALAPDGTYELCGPKVQGNPEGFADHVLVLHGCMTMDVPPISFLGLRSFLEPLDIEGIVWHHPDGRMCKIRKRDLGLKRTVQ